MTLLVKLTKPCRSVTVGAEMGGPQKGSVESIALKARRHAFGKWLRDWVTARGISAAQLAKAMGCNDSVVSKWLKGQTLPGAEHRPALAQYILNAEVHPTDGTLEALAKYLGQFDWAGALKLARDLQISIPRAGAVGNEATGDPAAGDGSRMGASGLRAVQFGSDVGPLTGWLNSEMSQLVEMAKQRGYRISPRVLELLEQAVLAGYPQRGDQ